MSTGMKRFLIRRIATFTPTVLGVIFLAFIIAYILPADTARAWAGGEKASPVTIERIKRQYHLDDPWYLQFVYLVHGVFTNSITDPITGNLIFDDLFRAFPVTVQLAIFGMFFTLLIGISLGILAALKRDTKLDTAVRIMALIGVATPIFWLAYIFIYVFFVMLGWITVLGVPSSSRVITYIPILDAIILGEFSIVGDMVKRYALPGFLLGFLNGGVLARIVRNSFLDAIQSDFIDYARARGLYRTWIWKHAFKNAFVPVITVIGLTVGGLLTGAIMTETVFGLPGIGRYSVRSIFGFDFPAIVCVTLLFGLVYVSANLVVDIIYAITDPRIRY